MPGYGAPHCLSGGDKAGPLPHTKGHWETVCTGHASSELQPRPVFNVILGLVGYGNVATLCSMLYLDWCGMEMLQPCVQCYTWTGGVWKCCNPVFKVILGLVGYGNVATLGSMLYLDWCGMEMLQPCVQCYTWTGGVWKCCNPVFNVILGLVGYGNVYLYI